MIIMIDRSVGNINTLTLHFSAKVWQRILALGEEEQSVSSLSITPTLFGERHAPEGTATVTNIDLGNVSLGKVTRSLCKGVIANMHR